ncbi:MAG: hydroxyacid dehydrogenase [Planctomycetota bacterium]
MKIVVYELEGWERGALDALAEDHDLVRLGQPLTADTAPEHADAEAIWTFIYSDLDADVLQQFDDLKLIATRSTGFDHIDVDYCDEKDITVCNVPSYGKNTVAEHVFGLLLTISHRLYEAVDRTRKGDFSHKGLEGFDLKGKTLGVIGTGDIGLAAIRIARGFGMHVVAFDVAPRPEAAEELGVTYLDMDDVLAGADVITLHVPGNEKTRHLISGEQFDRMKDGVVLINTSRGQVVDDQALMQALAEGKVSAAGLDVLPEEPVIREEAELLRSVYQRRHNLESLLADHVLLRMRSVVVTPHSAFKTCEAIGRILDTTVANIADFAAGQPQNVVNPSGSKVTT